MHFETHGTERLQEDVRYVICTKYSKWTVSLEGKLITYRM